MASTRVTAPALHVGATTPGALARRAFSLSGVAPLGVFLALHLVESARALRGEDAFNRAVATVHGVPAVGLVLALLVYAPLALHAAIGLWLTLARAPPATPTPYSRPVLLAMRATGVVALAFLALHLSEMRALSAGPRLHGGELLTLLSADLSSTSHGVPWWGLTYLVGTGAVTFHFVAGVWGLLARTPRVADRVTRRWLAWAAGALGAAMWLLFVDVVVLHATGSRLVGRAASAPVSGEPCPPPGPTGP